MADETQSEDIIRGQTPIIGVPPPGEEKGLTPIPATPPATPPPADKKDG